MFINRVSDGACLCLFVFMLNGNCLFAFALWICRCRIVGRGTSCFLRPSNEMRNVGKKKPLTYLNIY